MREDHKPIVALIKPIRLTETLDPSKVRFASEYYYLDNLTARLVELGSDGSYRNSLAEEIDLSPSKKDINIKIREAFYSDGTPITSEHVVNSLKRLILLGSPHSDPKSFIRGASNITSLQEDVEGLKILSKRSFQIRLNKPMKELFYYLQLADYGILHPDQYTKKVLMPKDWFEKTSGPYKLLVKNGYTYLKSNSGTLNYHPNMPKTVALKDVQDEQKILEMLRAHQLDFGLLNFKVYSNNIEALHRIENVDYYGSKTGGIIYLALNLRSSKFSKLPNRQWLNKSIRENFKLTPPQKRYMEKAFQYFLPNAKGHISQNNFDELLDAVDLKREPQELSSGIKIRTVPGMRNYLPENFQQTLTKTLKIPTTIDFDIPKSNMIEALGERNFDAFIFAASMSYKVLGEALNLVYTSENPMFLDPTKKIHSLLSEYQSTDDPALEASLIRKILMQMTIDSECVPIAYFAGPKFYNSEKLDVSEMNFEESFQFWRLRLK